MPAAGQIGGLLIFFDAKLAEIGKTACSLVKKKDFLPKTGERLMTCRFIAGKPRQVPGYFIYP